MANIQGHFASQMGVHKMGEEAVINAADNLTSKIDKKHRKHDKKSLNKSHKCEAGKNNKLDIGCQCEDEKLNIKGGMKSSIFASPTLHRKFSRREGIAEQNDT